MSSVARPKGRLPARVYWVRRLMMLGVVLLLVVGVQQLLSSDPGGDGQAGGIAATPAGAPFALPELTVLPTPTDMVIKKKRRKGTLPRPQGACDPADLSVTPVVERANIGKPTRVILELTTTTSPACTVLVSSETVAVNISTDSAARELLWTTQDCPDALPESSVIARRAVPGRAVVLWDGRGSDDRCSGLPAYVAPGDYLVEAVALGDTEPEATQFRLGGPVRETITRTVTPTPTSSPPAQ